jgi:hypothetical protein
MESHNFSAETIETARAIINDIPPIENDNIFECLEDPDQMTIMQNAICKLCSVFGHDASYEDNIVFFTTIVAPLMWNVLEVIGCRKGGDEGSRTDVFIGYRTSMGAKMIFFKDDEEIKIPGANLSTWAEVMTQYNKLMEQGYDTMTDDDIYFTSGGVSVTTAEEILSINGMAVVNTPEE